MLVLVFDPGKGTSLNRSYKLAAVAALAALGLGAPIVDSAAAGPTAAAAKKCGKKRGGKKSAASKAKRGKGKRSCGRPGSGSPAAAQSVQPPRATPIVRASVSWNSTAQVDLFVWDEAGNVATALGNGIPDSYFSPPWPTGPGAEYFVDLRSPSTRAFSFGFCTRSAPLGTIEHRFYVRCGGNGHAE